MQIIVILLIPRSTIYLKSVANLPYNSSLVTKNVHTIEEHHAIGQWGQGVVGPIPFAIGWRRICSKLSPRMERSYWLGCKSTWRENKYQHLNGGVHFPFCYGSPSLLCGEVMELLLTLHVGFPGHRFHKRHNQELTEEIERRIFMSPYGRQIAEIDLEWPQTTWLPRQLCHTGVKTSSKRCALCFFYGRSVGSCRVMRFHLPSITYHFL